MAKRAFDILAALAGLVLLSPLLAAIAVAVRLDSPGPALQECGDEVDRRLAPTGALHHQRTFPPGH